MAQTGQKEFPAARITRPAPAPGGVNAMTPKEVSAILRRHVLLIVSLTILGLLLGGVSWYLLGRYCPKYTALTYITVLPPVERDPTVIGGGMVGKDIQYGYRLSMAHLIQRQSNLMELLESDKVKKTQWFINFGKTSSVRTQKALKDLKKRFRAFAERDAEFVRVSMTCGSGKDAKDIVNEMVDLFINTQGDIKRREVSVRLARLREKGDRLRFDLENAEENLNDVRRSFDLSDLEQRNIKHTITLKLQDLEIEQNDLVLEMRQLQAIVETLERQATGPIAEQVEHQIENDPIMVLLAQQLALQDAQLKGRLTKFGENHRVVRESQELINEIRRKRQLRKSEIAEQTRQSNLQTAQDQLTILSRRLEELEKIRQEVEVKQRDLDLARAQYERRMSIRDEREERLNEVKKQVSKLEIMLESPDTPKVKFVGYAPDPLEMSFPKWQIFFPGGIALGLMVAVGLAFLIELLNDLVRTPRDVARFLRIRLLGLIPNAGEDRSTEGIDLCHIVRQMPYSFISESYRKLRTNIRLSDSADTLKVLLVTSGAAGDGKTSVAANLATTFVAENKKVLLIDANFRRPCLDTIYPVPQQPEQQLADEDVLENNVSEQESNQPVFGLSTMLTGLCGYQQTIRPGGIEGLDIIDAGPIPPNPAELLGGAQMQQLLKRQRENYDYIIIDSPPVLLVSDSKMLARLVDGTILVFNAGATRRGAALRTIREMREVNARILGCVLMAVRALKGGYFKEQFRSYQEYQKLQLAQSAV